MMLLLIKGLLEDRRMCNWGFIGGGDVLIGGIQQKQIFVSMIEIRHFILVILLLDLMIIRMLSK